MKIGSFFLVLLVALVVLGYLLSDSIHLREDISNLKKEIGRLNQVVEQAEQEKQNALSNLQNTNQELLSCRQAVDQGNQAIARLSNENISLKEMNQQWLAKIQSLNTKNRSVQPKVIESTTFSLSAFIALSLGSIVMICLKRLQKQPFLKKYATQRGNYVHLTDEEINHLVQQRREAKKANTPKSNSW